MQPIFTSPVPPPTLPLHEWFQTPPGQYVLAWERAQFDAALAGPGADLHPAGGEGGQGILEPPDPGGAEDRRGREDDGAGGWPLT